MKLLHSYLCVPLVIASLCITSVIPAVAQSAEDGDETTCGIGLRTAYFRTYHYTIWICQDAPQSKRLTFVVSPLGRRFQKFVAGQSGRNFTAIANNSTFVVNAKQLEIRQSGKTIVEEKVLESAGSDAQSSALCDRAIQTTLKKLRGVRNTRNVRFRPYTLQGYANPPRANSDLYNFSFSGLGGENIMNSPRLLLNLSQRLIQRCRKTDAVTFGVTGTDYYTMFGKTGGQVRPFKCVSAGVPGRRALQWGEFICP